jgi:hypothetical protein
MPNLQQFTNRDGNIVLINLDRIEQVSQDLDQAQIWVGGRAILVRESVADINRDLSNSPQVGG